MTLRQLFAPLVRQHGLVKSAKAAGIHPSCLSEWITQNRPRAITDKQIERLAKAVGCELTVTVLGASRDVSDCHSITEG